jgi:protein O-mannosyl-transferase
LAAKGQFGDAIRHYEQALQLKPDFPAALVNLGTSLAATGQIQKAAGQFEAALRLEPDRLEAAIYLAEAYARLGRFVDAAVVAQRALDLARANGETQMAETLGQRLKTFQQQAASGKK